jgi:hypothetical protein
VHFLEQITGKFKVISGLENGIIQEEWPTHLRGCWAVDYLAVA